VNVVLFRDLPQGNTLNLFALLQMKPLRVTCVTASLAALDNWHTINRRNGILGKLFLLLRTVRV
jgi:hypothetical protein